MKNNKSDKFAFYLKTNEHLHIYSDLLLPRSLRYRGICVSHDFSHTTFLRESLHWASFDGNVILEIQSKFGPYVKDNHGDNRNFLKITEKTHF